MGLTSIAGQANEDLVSSLGFNFQFHFVEPNALQLEYLASLIDKGKLSTHISHVFPLHEIAKAHQQIETEHTRGKIVLTVS